MTSLVFDKDSMLNSTISVNSHAVYTVYTRLPGEATEIRSPGTGALVARINRRLFLPNTVTLPGESQGKATRISRWLKKTKLADGAPASQIEIGGQPTYLAEHEIHGLALFASDMQTILAHWQRNKDFQKRELFISGDMEQHQVEILTAFLFMGEKQRVEGTFMDASTAGTGLVKQGMASG
ncbi:hypothetical protein C8R43DRAFT_80163 [Mycena crocata]|nr:hypothetical protein C8R43DRAFT_80163 [Mycena crocata]